MKYQSGYEVIRYGPLDNFNIATPVVSVCIFANIQSEWPISSNVVEKSGCFEWILVNPNFYFPFVLWLPAILVALEGSFMIVLCTPYVIVIVLFFNCSLSFHCKGYWHLCVIIFLRPQISSYLKDPPESSDLMNVKFKVATSYDLTKQSSEDIEEKLAYLNIRRTLTNRPP